MGRSYFAKPSTQNLLGNLRRSICDGRTWGLHAMICARQDHPNCQKQFCINDIQLIFDDLWLLSHQVDFLFLAVDQDQYHNHENS